ncbi:MAG TPA: xanthine dehydrogenase family protein subunit M [Actinomycetota bacterium]|nr:xanthine dehydrogenase family protein subunit M [Actinomycetota bacterium]
MYPPPFEYIAPDTIEEALQIVAQYGDDCKVLSGGMSLIPLMKLRFASPEVIVDINRIQGLDYLNEEGGGLRVGALVRYRTLVRSDLLKQRYQCAADCAPQVADPVVRNRGTLVGSLCHADPQGDWGAVMLAMNGSVIARSAANGDREIPVDQFIVGPFQNSLNPGEIGVEARIPNQGERSFGKYLKLERKVGDFATAGVAVSIGWTGGSISHAGIALTGVGAANIKATSAESVLMGSSLNQGTIEEAARQAASSCDPKSDHRGSGEYKREIVRVFTVRALSAAAGLRAA